MRQTIGSCSLGKAQVEIAAEENEVGSGPYVLTFTLPEASVSVPEVSRLELLGLAAALQKVAEGDLPIERWDGQSGG
ncbi:MAG: hypothetical protein KF760_33580 [Candidatus Eremiobacteraeota bacterium]|nr:hypothetical protein [Candidatus Eremiobacteraeota bacterium]